MRRFIALGPALVVLLTAASLLVVAPRVLRAVQYESARGQILLARQTLDDDDILERLNRAVRGVAAAVQPTVVHLEVVSLPAVTSDDEDGRRGRGREGSTGAGWIYDDAGHVVTNAHVVRRAANISVQLFDGRVTRATLVGVDPFTDIAVLKLQDSDHLVPARRATAERVQLGDRVFAFGSPFGFKFSMSEGIVSGLGRAAGPASEFGGFSNYIQTDAAVNPGNSGGPLVDIRGRVVGMNVAIATARDNSGSNSAEGQSAGISFAIPLMTIENVVDQLVSGGKVERGFLGISNRGNGRWPARAPRQGILVDSPQAEGPAAAAGIQRGDVITAIANQAIPDWIVLRSVVSSTRPGQIVPVELWRDGGQITVNVTLGRMPTEALLGPYSFQAYALVLDSLQQQLGVRFSDRGRQPLIDAVAVGSPANLAGLPKDVAIEAINSRKVSDLADVAVAFLEEGYFANRPVTLTVRPVDSSDQQTVTVSLTGR